MKRKNTSGDFHPAKRARPHSRSENNSNTARNRPQQAINQSPFTSTPQQEISGANSRAKAKHKRKTDSAPDASLNEISVPQPSKRKEIIRKLAPPRPFPTVPPSVSASGPKSAHREGKNLICITRNTPLAAYLSRCKKLLVDDGFQVLHLHAMGAAIPHLLTLSVSLPPILPFAKDGIQLEVRTGTIEVMDEIIPEDEDEDIGLRTRGKGGVSVVLKVRDGRDGVPTEAQSTRSFKASGGKEDKREVIVVQEQDQEDEIGQDEE